MQNYRFKLNNIKQNYELKTLKYNFKLYNDLIKFKFPIDFVSQKGMMCHFRKLYYYIYRIMS